VIDRYMLTEQEEERLGDPSTSSLVMVGIVGTIIVIAIVFALQALFNKEDYEETRRKIYDVTYFEVRDLKNDQTNRLHQWSWVDRQAGAVQMPVDLAMQRVVADLKSGWVPMTPAQANAAIAAASKKAADEKKPETPR
jgi:hypothetical protein